MNARQEAVTVGVVVERRKSDSPWADHVWSVSDVLAEAPDAAPWTRLGGNETAERFYLGSAELVLYAVDTANFRDNLEQDAPKVWVSVRPTGVEPALELVGVTADPAEGEGYTNQIGDIVEALPMPATIAAQVAVFFARHHVEQPFIKRRRDRTKQPDEERLPPPVLRGGDRS